jgi:hypothetical protein
MDQQTLYKKWPNVSKEDLMSNASETVRNLYEILEKTKENKARCESIKYTLYFNLCTGGFVGLKDQFEQLGCCG